MGKAFGKIAIGAAIIGAAFLTGGASLAPTLTATVATGVTTVTALTTTSLGALMIGLGATTALTGIAEAVSKTPSTPAAQVSRLNLNTAPAAPLKTAFGRTAFAADVRYQEWNGPDQDITDLIVANASHRVEFIEEIWLDDELAWNATTFVQGKFRDYLGVDTYLEGAPNTGPTLEQRKWTPTTAHLTGCAFTHLRFKLSGKTKKVESPFTSGIPNRITFIGRGALLYDPRRDDTVTGGAGPMRAADQSTWRWTAQDGGEIGENIPLQILRVLLGSRINDVLALGCGLPARRIDMPSFLEAANLADEQVQMSTGGTEPRYHGGGLFAEDQDPRSTLDTLLAACNGRLREFNGKLGLVIAHNDLAGAATDDGLLDDDVIGAFTWNPDPSLDATPNIVRGKFTDPSNNSLFQMLPYADARLDSPDGIDRIFPFDLGAVQSATHAQRVAKQVLQRKQYGRSFQATFDIRAWKYSVGDVVPFTFAPLGFNRRLFRVEEQELGQDGQCVMTLRVEAADLYAWDGGDAPPVKPAEPNVYDSRNNPLILGIVEAGTTAEWTGVTGAGKPEDNATVGAPAGTKVGSILAEDVVSSLEEITSLEGPINTAIDSIRQALDAESTERLTEIQTLIAGAENLCQNGGLERGKEGITGEFGDDWIVDNREWGLAGYAAQNGTRSFAFPKFKAVPGETYSITADLMLRAQSGAAYVDIVFFKADDTVPDKGDGPEHPLAAPFDFDGTGDRRAAFAVSATAPAGTAYGIPRVVFSNVVNVEILGFRQVMVQRAPLPMLPYRQSLASAMAGYAEVKTAKEAITGLSGALSSLTTSVNARFNATADSEILQRLTTAASQAQSAAQAVTSVTSQLRSGLTANLLSNGDFKDGFSHWVGSGSGYNRGYDNAAGWYANASGGSGTYLYNDAQVTPGTSYSYSFEGFIYRNESGQGRVYAKWCDANGADVSAPFEIMKAFDWSGRRASTPQQCPANARIMRVVMEPNGASIDATRFMVQAGPATAWRDDASLAEMRANVTLTMSTLADALANKLTAYFSLIANIGGSGVAGIRGTATRQDGTTISDLALIAGSTGFWMPRDDGSLVQAMRVGLENGQPVTNVYGTLAARTVRANAFINNQGVDLAAIVPGEFNWRGAGGGDVSGTLTRGNQRYGPYGVTPAYRMAGHRLAGSIGVTYRSTGNASAPNGDPIYTYVEIYLTYNNGNGWQNTNYQLAVDQIRGGAGQVSRSFPFQFFPGSEVDGKTQYAFQIRVSDNGDTSTSADLVILGNWQFYVEGTFWK